jgi:acetyl-CoA synthetase
VGVPERYNIAADVCDKHPPQKLAMVHERFDETVREVTWGELQDLAAAAAGWLASLGVERGDRVAVILPSTPEAAAVFFGAWKLGAILLSMSVLYGDDGIRHRLQDSEAEVLVTDADNVGRFDRSWVHQIVVVDGDVLADADRHAETADTSADDPAQLAVGRRALGLVTVQQRSGQRRVRAASRSPLRRARAGSAFSAGPDHGSI